MTQRKPETIQALINRTHKVCPICGEDKSLTEYHKDKHDPYGYYGYCKLCRVKKCREGYARQKSRILDYIKAYRKTEEGKSIRRKEYKNRLEKYPEKIMAENILGRKIKSGIIKRGTCEICQKENAQGHHPDYSKPLEVVWLCQKHHQELHNKLRSL